jgi:DNA-binding response OmpR family regulator
MNIILVEDDGGIRDALQMVLERAGHEVVAYNDGSLILEDNYQPPEIFIIDRQLSGVDGIDICRHLKSADKTKNIPVIIMSASPDASKLAKQVCADAFLEKPFENEALMQIISRFA